MLLAYLVPAAAFVAVAGLVLVFTLTALRHKNHPPRRLQPACTQQGGRDGRLAASLHGLRDRPVPIAASQPPDADVLELLPDDFDPETPHSTGQRQAADASPASSGDWPAPELKRTASFVTAQRRKSSARRAVSTASWLCRLSST